MKDVHCSFMTRSQVKVTVSNAEAALQKLTELTWVTQNKLFYSAS